MEHNSYEYDFNGCKLQTTNVDIGFWS